jgi:hypothetical protein
MEYRLLDKSETYTHYEDECDVVVWELCRTLYYMGLIKGDHHELWLFYNSLYMRWVMNSLNE